MQQFPAAPSPLSLLLSFSFSPYSSFLSAFSSSSSPIRTGVISGMYAPGKTADYYGSTAGLPPPSMGIPAASINQYYSQNAPLPLQVQSDQGAPTPWSTGLCQCCDDVGNCCVTCFCPCITFGRIAEIVDRGSSSCGTSGALYTLIACVTGCPCMYSCFYRSKMRRQHGLAGGSCSDCVIHCFCETCALCQEYRELTNRGFDLPIGWQGNMEQQGHTLIVPPLVGGGAMTR